MMSLHFLEEDEFACFSNLLLNCTISNHLHDSKKVHLSLPTKTDVDGFLKVLHTSRLVISLVNLLAKFQT